MIFWIIFWFIVLAALVAIEVVTADLLTIWFMPAAVVCIVLAALKVSFPIQIIVFFVLSAIFVVLYKKVLKKYIDHLASEAGMYVLGTIPLTLPFLITTAQL